RELHGHFIEERERAVEPVRRGRATQRSERVLQLVREVGDLAVADDSSGALERVGEPEHARDELGGDALLGIGQALGEPGEDLAGLDPEVLVAILRHQLAFFCTISSRLVESPASCDAVWRVWVALASVSRVAPAAPVIAWLTCSTAVACCLVDSSISRAA